MSPAVGGVLATALAPSLSPVGGVSLPRVSAPIAAHALCDESSPFGLNGELNRVVFVAGNLQQGESLRGEIQDPSAQHAPRESHEISKDELLSAAFVRRFYTILQQAGVSMLGDNCFYKRRPSLDPKRRPSLSSSLESATLGGGGTGGGSGRRRPSIRDPGTRGAASPPSIAHQGHPACYSPDPSPIVLSLALA